MRSLKQYIGAIGYWGLLMLAPIALDIIGSIQLATSCQFTGVPSWVWFNLGFVALLIIPFIAFNKIRNALVRGENRIAELENNKPYIEVMHQKLDNTFCLNVFNEGERAILKAQICIISSNTGNVFMDLHAMGKGYDAIWNETNTHKTELLKGQSGIVKIATIESISVYAEKIILYAYDLTTNSAYTLESSSWMQTDDNHIIKPEFILQVNISSDPSLRPSCPNLIGGAFVRNYEVSLDGIKELPIQPIEGFSMRLIKSETIEDSAGKDGE